MNITNNTILITGGTSGIGLEFAKQMIDLGNTVLVTGRDLSKLETTKKALPKVHIFQSDVSDPNAIYELYGKVIKQFPKINILVNNAGEMRRISLHDHSVNLENITKEIEINLSGPIRMVQQFLPYLKTQGNAAIVNVTSGVALIPFPISPIYGASKSGLRSYTKSLRIQLKKTSVKVFEVVAPGAKTSLNDKFSDEVDRKSLMEPAKLVSLTVQGIEKNNYEIYPGMANVLKIMSRLAPNFVLNQMAKPVDRMLNT